MEETVSVCSKCGSTKLKSFLTMTSDELAEFNRTKPLTLSMENPAFFLCKECGFHGICPQIDKSEVNSFRSGLKRMSEPIKPVNFK